MTAIEIGRHFRGSNDDSCFHYFNLAIDMGKKEGEYYELAEAYRQLAYRQYKKGGFEEARRNYFKSAEIASTHGYDGLEGKVNMLIGELYFRNSKRDSAKIYSFLAQKKLTAADDNKSLNVVYNTLGAIYAGENLYDSTVVYFTKALECSRLVKDSVGMSNTYQNIGIIYGRMDEHEKAIEQIKKSIELKSVIPNQHGITAAYFNLSRQYRLSEQYDKAIEAVEKAITLGNENKEIFILPNAYNTYGNCLLETGNYKKAIPAFQEAITKYEAINNLTGKAQAVQNLGLSYEQIGKIKLANKQMDLALSITNKEEEPYNYMGILEHLSRYNENRGRDKIALTQLREFHQISDSLFTLEKQEKVLELQTKFETAEAENENILLRKDNELQATRISQQNTLLSIGVISALVFLSLATFLYLQRKKLRSTKRQLEASLGEKETLLKEIHHRVKNNLQLVTSLLNIQAEKESPQTIGEFLTQGQNRVKSMALIHEQLYRSDNVSSINMQEYFEKLVKSILEIHGNPSISYEIQTENNHLDIDKAIPLGLIINELVNNSLKHAFTNNGAGNLQVQMKEIADQLEVNIKDDGKGFPSEPTKNSIGLQLVNILAKQLRGRFEFHHQIGTTARLVFPKA